jgi:hypothetical protein
MQSATGASRHLCQSPLSSSTSVLLHPNLYTDWLSWTLQPSRPSKILLGFQVSPQTWLLGLGALPSPLRALSNCSTVTGLLVSIPQQNKTGTRTGTTLPCLFSPMPCKGPAPIRLMTLELSGGKRKMACPSTMSWQPPTSSLDRRQDLLTWSGTWGRCRSLVLSAVGWQGPSCYAASQELWTEAICQRRPLRIGRQTVWDQMWHSNAIIYQRDGLPSLPLMGGGWLQESGTRCIWRYYAKLYLSLKTF